MPRSWRGGSRSSAWRSTPSSPPFAARCSAGVRWHSVGNRTRAHAPCVSECPVPFRSPTHARSSTRYWPVLPPTATSPAGASSIESSTSIRTCRRTIRYPSSICRSAPGAGSTSISKRRRPPSALTARRFSPSTQPRPERLDWLYRMTATSRAWESRESTWRKTRARWCMSAARREGCRARQDRSWTSTVPGRRSWNS